VRRRVGELEVELDSPGRRLLALAEAGGGIFELPGTDDGAPEQVDVAAHVADYKLGAHASADELVTITARVAPGVVMLVHGEPTGQRQLRERLAFHHRTCHHWVYRHWAEYCRVVQLGPSDSPPPAQTD